MGKVTNHQEEQDSFARLASYPHTPEKFAAIKIDAGQHERIRNSIAHPFPRSPSTALTINRLPPEIILEVVSLLDIQSLFRFRQLNRYARELVSAVHGYYETIMTHALDVVCALLRTNMASWFTLRDLFDVLCTQYCSICGYFGGLLFLPSLERVCSECILEDAPFSMLSATVVAEKFELSLEFLHQLVPVLSIIPGKYGEHSHSVTEKSLIVAPYQVSKAAAASGHQVGDKWNRLPPYWECRLNLRRMATIHLPCLRRTGGRGVLCTLQCRGCLFAFDKTGGSVSIESRHALSSRDRLYSPSDLLEHLEHCPLAKVVVDYLGLKSKGDNLNFKMLGKFQRRWHLGDKDIFRLSEYHWWSFAI